MVDQIDRNNCRTRNKNDDLWECLAYKYAPCVYRNYHGDESYCLHKDHSDFSVWSDRRSKQ